MSSFLRMLLVAVAMLTSGALQAAAVIGDGVCCAGETEEKDAPCPDCPPGLPCACCPMGGAVQAAAPGVAPSASPGVVIAVAAAEPSLATSATDIFHPPRA